MTYINAASGEMFMLVFMLCTATRTRIGLLLVFTGLGFLASEVSESREEVLSFEMWCLEMQSYPAERCNTRRVDDVKDYQQYRASIERYQAQRSVQDKRDKAIQEKLNRDPTNPSRQ